MTKKSKTKRQPLPEIEGLPNNPEITERLMQADEVVRLNLSRMKSLVRIIEKKFESVQEFLDYALEEAISLTGSKIGYIFYYDEDKNKFILNAWSKDVMSECRLVNPETIYNLENTGIWGEAVRQRKEIIINDFQAAHPLKKGYPEGHATLYKYMTVPVFNRDKIVAVIGVANKKSDYNSTDVMQLTLLMDSAWKIVEERKLVNSLWENEEFTRQVIESSPDCIKILDFEGRLLSMSAGGQKLLEIDDITPFLNRSWIDLWNGKEREDAQKAFSKAVKGDTGTFDGYCETVKGKPKWWNVVVSPIKDLRGNSSRILAVSRDITERKMAEDKIEHLASFPEMNPIPVIETDLKGRIIYCNNSTLRVLKELNAPQDARLFLPPDLNDMIKKMEMENASQNFSHELEIDGRVFIESIFVSAKLKVVRIYAQDITSRKIAEDALQKVNSELEQRVEERTAELRVAIEHMEREIEERINTEKSLSEALSEINVLKDRLETENIYLQKEIKTKHQYINVIGKSDGLKYVLYRAEQVAPTNTTVLILGETGTGKELIAGAIHNMSRRKDRPMITVNCAALPANLMESELFGREKGAFTGADTMQIGRFEIANGSTLCLDEIGELPLEMQAKLLRAIQHSEFERLGSSRTIKVDVRIIATTNRNLEEAIRKGWFRQDLYYRLNVFSITVPPLRQRQADIPLMVHSFIERYARKLGKQITSINKETMKILQDYSWPGNVRELESVIEKAAILSPGPVLTLTDRLSPSSLSSSSASTSSSTAKTLEEAERNQIVKILSESRWRIEGKNGAAETLGLHPSTLRARMHKLGIRRPGS